MEKKKEEEKRKEWELAKSRAEQEYIARTSMDMKDNSRHH
jgi:hypothetical protein